ncbi:hypothetical protein HPB51_002251 [Rhipicephalus microplus]|uniref:Reverse transcriptase domain-containing protein n=1 Tax=Rhipicephalus microplus TaxID=6941 RepID=A0A9J6E6H2_RHIMP|nr:hypothetical protein HPB51_002251 [Rhipicephalus microplus]
MKLALFQGVTENSIVAINDEESEKRVGTSKRSTFHVSHILSMVSKALNNKNWSNYYNDMGQCLTSVKRVIKRLEALSPGIQHCLYADDVTIWVTGGSDGEIESNLQNVVCAVEAALLGTGLRCSPQKSQLLILPPPG